MNYITGIISGVIVGMLSGYAGYIYRDSFDAPKLQIEYARIAAPDRAIAVVDDVVEALKVDGNVKSFIKERVEWDVPLVVDQNEYTYEQVGEIRALLPAVRERFDSLSRQLTHDLAELTKAKDQVDSDLANGKTNKAEIARSVLQKYPTVSRKLASLRIYFMTAWKLDIFDGFYTDPSKILGLMISDRQGDLTQANETLQTIQIAAPEFERVWKMGAPGKQPIVGATVPTVLITVVLSNSGRTNSLVRNEAKVSFGSNSANLVRYNTSEKRIQRSVNFEKAPAGDTLQMTFTLDADTNTPDTLRALYDAVVTSKDGLVVTVYDVARKNYSHRAEH